METQALRALSRKTGVALLAVCALQLAVAPVALLRPHLPPMSGEFWFNLLALLSSGTVFAGALAGRKLLGKADSGRQDCGGQDCGRQDCGRQECGRQNCGRPAGRPYSFDDCLLIPAGAALCMLGNLVGAFVEQLAGRAGVVFRGPVQAAPESLPGILLMLLTVGVLPAAAEELLLRGVILPALRPFGDAFAVVCSAALFALLHQNMVQAPMAFVAGLALGWVYIRSGRLAIPMAVHLWNNAASVLLLRLPDRAANLYALALAVLGIVSLLVLYVRRPAPVPRACETPGLLPPGKRAVHFFFGSAAMVTALAYFGVMIGLNVGFG